MADAVVVDRLEIGWAGGCGDQALRCHPGTVFEQGNDRARVDAGRAEQLVTVLPRARQGPLVRQDARLRPEWLQPKPRKEPPLRPLDVRPRHHERLLVDVDGRMRILAQGPIRAPGGQRPGGAPVAILRFIAGGFDRKVETDDVRGVASLERRPQVRPDDVVRRRDHEARIAHHGSVETERAERSDLGHGLLGMTAGWPTAHGTAPSYDRSRFDRDRRGAGPPPLVAGALSATFRGSWASLLRSSPLRSSSEYACVTPHRSWSPVSCAPPWSWHCWRASSRRRPSQSRRRPD